MHHAALLQHSFQNAKAYGWQLDKLPTHDWYDDLFLCLLIFFILWKIAGVVE